MDINARNVRENRQILQFSGYSYQDLKNDLHIYSRIFEKIVQITTLARTTDGREIFQARIGKPDAQTQNSNFCGDSRKRIYDLPASHGFDCLICKSHFRKTDLSWIFVSDFF